jgi:N4-gp56 family major capsid protein
MDTVLTNVEVTFAAGDYSYGQIGITEHDVDTSRVDKFKIAKSLIAQEIANCPDVAIATALQSTSITNVVWGGGKTRVEDLRNGDVMTVDLLTDASTLIEDKDFVPYACVLHPFQTSRLKKSAQFTDASKLGSDRVNLRGMIGEFAGIKVIQSTNAPYVASAGTDINENAAVGANMYVGIMVGVGQASVFGEGGTPDMKESLDKVAGAYVWKKKPIVRYNHDLDSAMHNFYLDMAGKATAVQTDAIALIKTTKV